MAQLVDWLFLAGRLAFGGFFVASGMSHAFELDRMTAWADGQGLPFPTATVVASGLVLVLGGAGVLLGILPHASLLALAAFLVLAAGTMHTFWRVEDEALRRAELSNFSKNLALAGAALALTAVDTPWPFSL